MTDARRAVLHSNSADIALVVPASPDPVEAIRAAARAWAAVHAHYFGPDVIDRAARLLTDNGVPTAGTFLVRRDTLLAYLHLAARS